ncbi:hypothetical protein [Nostoc sp.]|uniref:hypothetical protein n=1 Tax=Nostoc sp. TaxID=1180 RepID=UPI002FFCBF09
MDLNKYKIVRHCVLLWRTRWRSLSKSWVRSEAIAKTEIASLRSVPYGNAKGERNDILYLIASAYLNTLKALLSIELFIVIKGTPLCLFSDLILIVNIDSKDIEIYGIGARGDVYKK